MGNRGKFTCPECNTQMQRVRGGGRGKGGKPHAMWDCLRKSCLLYKANSTMVM